MDVRIFRLTWRKIEKEEEEKEKDEEQEEEEANNQIPPDGHVWALTLKGRP